MPSAPTKGTPLTIEDQMLYAPPGVKEPTKFMPFLQDLDFSGLPRYEDIRDIRSFEDIRPTLFDIDLDVEEMLKDIDTEKLADIDIPSVAPVFPEVPVMPQTPVFTQPVIPSVEAPQVPVMPQVPVQEPMNFTGLPQMPVMPELPVMPQPIVQQPIMPMNFTRLSDLPVSNFVQPSVDEIVSPISRGKTLPLPQRGLFGL